MSKPQHSFRFINLIAYQLIVGLSFAALMYLITPDHGLSALIGVLLIFAANTLMLVLFFYKKSYNPTAILIRLYSGEFCKWIILALGVLFVAKNLKLIWWAFIGGIALVQVSYCVVPYFMCKKGAVTL